MSCKMSFPVRAQSEAKLPAGFVSQGANVDGLKLHYTPGDHGSAVVLLYDFAATSQNVDADSAGTR